MSPGGMEAITLPGNGKKNITMEKKLNNWRNMKKKAGILLLFYFYSLYSITQHIV